MQIKDILKFNKDKYFGGAVQANWFYDCDKVKAIADSYVFHGPKYHGVSQQESQNTNYKLNEEKMFADVTDGIAIIINSETGIYYGLNALGSAVYENLVNGASVEDILTDTDEITDVSIDKLTNINGGTF